MPRVKKGEPGSEEVANKWRAAITAKYGSVENFTRMIGKKGGQNSRGNNTGFACNTVGKDGLTGRERAKIAGRKGGAAGRRSK